MGPLDLKTALSLAVDRTTLAARARPCDRQPMPSNPGAQKKHDKRRKRAEAMKRDSRSPSSLDRNAAAIVRTAVSLPMGPSFISADWRVEGEVPPLVTLVVTRISPAHLAVPIVVLVDRTCLGVKNVHIDRPMPKRDLTAFLRLAGQAYTGGLVPCDLLAVQSVVFQAIDYARSLGFEPHRDFSEALLGPRPTELMDTPFSRPDRPLYVEGPHDPVITGSLKSPPPPCAPLHRKSDPGTRVHGARVS